jgi:hypothetical protein
MTEPQQAVELGIAFPPAEDTSQVQSQPVAPVTQAPTDAEINFRALRAEKERLQTEWDKDRQRMALLQDELLRRSEAPKVQEIDEFADVDSNDWMTYEKSQKLIAKHQNQTEKLIADALERAEAKRHKAEAPNRIKARFGDFDSVVTEENVRKLQAMDPDVAAALGMIGDDEAKAVAAYKYIKALVPNVAENSAAKQRIQENANLPKSLSSVGANSPLSAADAYSNGLTPELKKQLFAEMQSYSKRS